MDKPLSINLRSRMLTAVDEGMSSARRRGVSAALVVRGRDQRRSSGDYAGKTAFSQQQIGLKSWILLRPVSYWRRAANCMIIGPVG